MMNPEEFADRLWEFAVSIGRLVDTLPSTRLGRHVSNQLVRCGTSSAPNYEEACSAESRADFTHKLGVAAKEMRETRGWLKYVIKTEMRVRKDVDPLLGESDQLLRLLSKSLITAKRNRDSGSAL